MREELTLVSMACRFPAAPTTQDFWESLKQGHDALSEIPLTRWDAQRYYDPKPGTVGKCATTKGYFLDDVRQFDPGFFKIQPEDAEVMDPQQRILLELCQEAFDSAGYSRDSLSGQKIGVFMGITKSDYQNNIAEALARQELTQKTVVTGILENLIAARIAHYFDLTGPALTLDTACSSSLVALHMAKESILAGDCEMALVGGINLNLNVPAFLGMSAAHALSAGEHYHVFDRRASGFFMGEGGGVVLLKKRSQALADQNTILAVLSGTAVNNDGRAISPMAPRSTTQQTVLRKACEDAQLSPADITLIEAHGTGTPLGDAVEAQTLNAVFAGISPKPVLSSVKPNIGHLLSAAGMGSIIKVLLCFQHRQIPPLLHYAETRKQLNLEAQGFRLNTELLDIPDQEQMVAGINGFGFGGTNAHIILKAESQAVPEMPFRQIVPSYQKQTYWVGLKEPDLRPSLASLELASPGPELRCFESRWFAQELPAPVASGSTREPLLIIADPLLGNEHQRLTDALTQAGQRWLSSSTGPELQTQLSHDSQSYVWVLLLPISSQALYDFIQTLAKSAFLARCQRLVVVTQGALPLEPAGQQIPGVLSLEPFLDSGLLWGAASEISLPVTQIDLAPQLTLEAQVSELVLCLTQPQLASQLALRGPNLWQRSQRQVSLNQEPPLPSRLRKNGVYLITGGGSGIGALISESLVERLGTQAQLQLIVVGRRAAEDVPGLDTLQHKIQAQGSQLHYYRLDISQSAEVRLLCQQILRQYGGLHGVIHAAGQVAPRDLRRTPYQERLTLMAPKVQGLPYLRESLLELAISPDFFVAFSSLSAALPGYGRGLIDYVAANHFMDLYAASVAQSPLPIQVIQWGPWQGSGMAAHPVLQQQLASWGLDALSPAEGITAFHAFIDGGYEQALILKTNYSLQDLKARLPVVAAPKISASSRKPAVQQVVGSSCQSFSQNQDLTQSQLEQRLQGLIQGSLAESGEAVLIQPEDNLMDIGIDSLAAIELTKTLSDWGYQDLPFELFFEQQSIRELATFLLSQSQQNITPEAIWPNLDPEPVLPNTLIPLISLPSAQGAFAAAPQSGPLQEDPLQKNPLSPIQAAFFVAQTLYQRPNYSYFRLSLSRVLDPVLLEQACWELLNGHAQLRAVFQQELDPSGLRLTYQIWSREQIQADIQRQTNQSLIEVLPAEQNLLDTEDGFVNRLFDLAQAPLFRIGLQESPQGSHLLLLFHHIIFDGISMRNLLQEFWQRYRALERQIPFVPAQQAVTYQDYVQGVLKYRDSEAFQEAVGLLSEYLKSKPTVSTPFLTALAERYAKLGSAAAQSLQRQLPLACSEALIKQAEIRQTPLQMLYLSAFFTALSQWSDQSKLWVQVASAGRHWPLADIHSLIGSFAELFPVYADLSQDRGLALARSLRQEWNTNQSLQRVGSDQIARLAQEMGLSLPFSFSFAHFDRGWMPAEDQAQVISTQMRGHHAQTQLGLLISENNSGFYYSFNTPQGLFSEMELKRLSTLFETALNEISTPVAPADFWTCFQAAPDLALALKTPEQELNYSELRRSSQELAQQLASQGLSCGSVLAFRGDASPDSICLLLACLDLGVTWVPIDAQSPARRVIEICRQAKVDLLVSSQSLPATEAIDAPFLSLSELLSQAEQNEDPVYPSPERSEDSLAYIIFTSGTSGRPKGVPILYSALMRYLDWALESFQYTPQDRVILTSSLAFDACLRPILATLMSGGCLCPVTDQSKRDPQVLLNWVRQVKITVWSSVPSLWQGLIQAIELEPAPLENNPLPDLRLVQVGGEALAPHWLQRWQARMGTELPVVNLYGPTETTLNATSHWIRGPHPEGHAVPIGKALPYLSCLVMSESEQPCHPDQPGELWVSGPSLTPGYLSATVDSSLIDLVPKAATKSPFVNYQGQRYYRTGDRVYQDAAGLLYYLGRQDRQIKLRGYRIEPAEIEQVLLEFPELLEAWVDQLQWPSGSLQLVACVRSAKTVEQAELMAYLAQRLPDYMLPQQIHCFSDFPRLSNGKLDTEVLKQTLLKSNTQTTASPPLDLQDTIATRVSAIWQTLLKQNTFAEDADFFQLGGDSLLLMQAYLMLQQDWPQLPKIAQFHSQRRWQDWVRLLREYLPEEQPENTPLVPILPQPVDSGFALSPSQIGFYLWHQHLETDDSLWEARLQLEGDLDPYLFEQALELAARRHQMLNVQLKPTSPPVFVPSSVPRLGFHYQDLSAEADPAAAQGHYLSASRLQTLDIFTDPLLRCHLLKQASNRYLWVIQAHHILADGLSGLILGRDIFRAYRQLLSAGQQPTDLFSNRPPLRAQFSDYIALLAQDADQAQADLDYWQSVFTRPYQAPDLRSAAHQPLARSSTSGFFVIERSLSQLALADFKQSCQAAHSTIFMGVLAAYQQALIRLTGQSDLIIGVAHHGRDYALADIDQIFGCFARTLPLRLPAPADGLGIQAAQVHYQGAAAHTLDPVRLLRRLRKSSRLLRHLKHLSRLQNLLGSQFFMSYVDMNLFLERESVPGLRLDWQASSTHFQPSNQDTDLFLALKQQGDSWIFTLNVHQAACSPAQAEAFLDQLLETITLPSPPQPLAQSKGPRVQTQAFDLAQAGSLDAALISYLPSLDQIERAAPSLSLDQIQAFKARLFPDQQALWLERLQTPLGQSANLVLPFFANEIQPGQAKQILPAIQRARQQAQALGARVVSLAGLLPALSSYGLDLPAIEAAPALSAQRLTTGHSTTVLAMLYTIRSVLTLLERPLDSCHLAVVGLGSIGEATLKALLATQAHPASLILVDRMGSVQRLKDLAERLSREHQYSGAIKVLQSQQGLPPEVYQADLIISAVSARQVIEIANLRPGTVLVDDSFPHCFDVKAAITRMQQQSDVLVLGGGLLHLPDSQKEIYLPLPHPDLQRALTQISLPACLPGCQLESLLLAAYPELPETLGLVEPDKLLQYLPVLEAAGIQAAPLHLEGYLVPADLVTNLIHLAKAAR